MHWRGLDQTIDSSKSTKNDEGNLNLSCTLVTYNLNKGQIGNKYTDTINLKIIDICSDLQKSEQVFDDSLLHLPCDDVDNKLDSDLFFFIINGKVSEYDFDGTSSDRGKSIAAIFEIFITITMDLKV